MDGRRIDFMPGVRAALADAPLQRAVSLATLKKTDVRNASFAKLKNAEDIRTLAGLIKQHTLDHLDRYLEQFVAHFEKLGGVVHFAETAAEANAIICRIAQENGSKLCVKAKSMTTEETHLNAALEKIGVQTVETDLGEFIVQIDHDRPSHIVTPIIHKDRFTVARAMHRELGVPYTEDPTELTQHARVYLRDIFRRADLGVTGVNFAIAETGTICICTNEGNGRLCTTRPKVHVALMGIEKVIPRFSDLPVFLKMLARSSTGQPLTVYTSLINGPRRAFDRDGPEKLHVVIMDAGRTGILEQEEYREVLRCIRCGACLNGCPVYRKIGGHAYQSTYPGPIGKLVTPLLKGLEPYADLPQASSLCGVCKEVCPVRIDIPEILVKLRRDQVGRGIVSPLHRLAFRLAGWTFAKPWRYRLAQRFTRFFLNIHATGGYTSTLPVKSATKVRDMAVPPGPSFRQRWEAGLRDEAALDSDRSGQ
ncbi:MAG: iron-sulfur cluster-binding protein [Phycisphaerales bacterium]|nr:iron-sulfur cluster-binding protein [Phycisphaerales bacterium]